MGIALEARRLDQVRESLSRAPLNDVSRFLELIRVINIA